LNYFQRCRYLAHTIDTQVSFFDRHLLDQFDQNGRRIDPKLGQVRQRIVEDGGHNGCGHAQPAAISKLVLAG